MDIYRITNKDTGESILIGSKEYIDLKFKVLKDTLVNYIKNKNPSEDVNFSILDNESVVDISEVLENSNSIRAQNVIEDDQHMFLTNKQIQNMNSKISSFEAERLINDAKNQLQIIFNDQYVRLLNLPDAVNKLREISDIVKDNDEISSIVDLVNDKVTKEELEEHAKSNTHLSDNDRNAINILLDKFYSGDLESIGEDIKYAENTSRIDNLSLESIHKCKREELIIGNSDKYSPGEVDLLMDLDPDRVIEILNFCAGIVVFKPGVYEFNNSRRIVRESSANFIIEGCGDYYVTEFKLDGHDIVVNDFITIRNCTITGNAESMPTLFLTSNIKFENIRFYNCNFVLDHSEFINFRDCHFNNCNFKIKSSTYIKIVDNYLYNTKIPKLLGTTNIIKDNIKI